MDKDGVAVGDTFIVHPNEFANANNKWIELYTDKYSDRHSNLVDWLINLWNYSKMVGEQMGKECWQY